MKTLLPAGARPRGTTLLPAVTTGDTALDFLGELHAEFLSVKRAQHVTPRTLEWHGLAFRLWRQVSAEVPTSATVKAFVENCQRRDLSSSSINTYLRSLKTFSLWLKVSGYADTVPTFVHPKETVRAIRVLRQPEVTRLLAVAMRPRLRFLMQFILKTGLRIDEALHLTWDQVDIENGVVLVHGKGQKERYVPLELEWCQPPLWRFDIGPLWFQHRRRFKALPLVGPTPWVFPSRNNTPVDKNTSRVRLHAAMQRAGVLRDWRSGWHLLRHSYATEYLNRGGRIERLQRILGHEKITTTQRYLHFVTDDLKKL